MFLEKKTKPTGYGLQRLAENAFCWRLTRRMSKLSQLKLEQIQPRCKVRNSLKGDFKKHTSYSLFLKLCALFCCFFFKNRLLHQFVKFFVFQSWPSFLLLFTLPLFSFSWISADPCNGSWDVSEMCSSKLQNASLSGCKMSAALLKSTINLFYSLKQTARSFWLHEKKKCLVPIASWGIVLVILTGKVAPVCTLVGPLFVDAERTPEYYALIGRGRSQTRRAEAPLSSDSRAIQ